MNSSDLSGRPTWSRMIGAERLAAARVDRAATARTPARRARPSACASTSARAHLVDERAAVAVAMRAHDAAAPHVEHVARAAELDGAAGDARFELRPQAERVEQAQLEDAQRLGARRRRLERREEGHEQLEDLAARAGAAGSARAPASHA